MATAIHEGQLLRVDGTRIAYRVVGARGPWMLLCNGVTTTHDFWDGAARRWPDRRLIQWDYPGHGTSSPAASPAAAHLPALAEVCVELLDTLEIEQASIVGFSMGSQVALLAGLEYPHRFDAVVSLLGPAGGLFDTALWGVGGKTAAALLKHLHGRSVHLLHGALNLATRSPATYAAGRLLGLFGAETSTSDLRKITTHLRRVDAPTVREMLLSAGALDLRPRLASLRPPLLIISGERDAFAPASTVGRPMKQHAPQARLVVLREGTHGSLFGHADLIAASIDRFLENTRATPAQAARGAD
ncbi:MAG: alpha/beta hydrolase [Nannocystaceae bacterium]|nr:alpha/beta hydrolase [Nannocystaceae bacterium]